MINCLLQGMKTNIKKAANCENVRELHQDRSENPAVFPSRLSEALCPHTAINPESPEGKSILAMHFISQLAPDIHRKPPKLENGIYTCSDLLELAFKVFSNQDEEANRPIPRPYKWLLQPFLRL